MISYDTQKILRSCVSFHIPPISGGAHLRLDSNFFIESRRIWCLDALSTWIVTLVSGLFPYFQIPLLYFHEIRLQGVPESRIFQFHISPQVRLRARMQRVDQLTPRSQEVGRP